MRLGFNWTKGPFEMLEEIGVENFFSKIDDIKGNTFLENLSHETEIKIFMDLDKNILTLKHLEKLKRKH